MTADLDIIILAAGLGTRMKSDTIKIAPTGSQAVKQIANGAPKRFELPPP